MIILELYNNNFANFSGRASRSEYSYYILFKVFLVLVIFLMNGLTNNSLNLFFNLCIFQLVIFVPMQAVTIRRLRDLGMKWNYIFFNFIPFFNFILTTILLITPGQRGENQYGEDPKMEISKVQFD